jgi:hypothetical protein
LPAPESLKEFAAADAPATDVMRVAEPARQRDRAQARLTVCACFVIIEDLKSFGPLLR